MGHHGYPGDQKPDCSAHHPSTNLVKGDNQPQFQLAGAGYVAANQLLESKRVLVFTLSGLSRWSLPPPPILGSSLHQKISILRI